MAQTLFARALIGPARNGEELRALQVAALGPCDLAGISAALLAAQFRARTLGGR